MTSRFSSLFRTTLGAAVMAASAALVAMPASSQIAVLEQAGIDANNLLPANYITEYTLTRQNGELLYSYCSRYHYAGSVWSCNISYTINLGRISLQTARAYLDELAAERAAEICAVSDTLIPYRTGFITGTGEQTNGVITRRISGILLQGNGLSRQSTFWCQ